MDNYVPTLSMFNLGEDFCSLKERAKAKSLFALVADYEITAYIFNGIDEN